MRRIFTLLLLISVLRPSLGQENSPEIKLAVLGPELSIEGLTQNHKNKLKTKIQQMVSRHGIVSTNFIQDFIIYPEFEIYVDDSTESTYGFIYDIEAELTLKAENIKTKSLIAAPFPFKIKGASRSSRNDAITKAIGKIDTRGPEVADFIAEIKRKVIAHYEANCSTICENAGKLIALGRPEDAIVLLYSVPQHISVGCNERVAKLLDLAYSAYSSLRCNGILAEAKKAIAEGKVKYAKSLLVLIGEESTCYSKAQQLIAGLDPTKDPTPPEKIERQLEKRKQVTVKQAATQKGKEDDKAILCAKRLRTDCD
ncbi:MAG: hypothetical protein HRT65_00570 [Flavobacteriaceae bacterium]|nr:hypothetical protein [Flavobacteriaceae bacterium]